MILLQKMHDKFKVRVISYSLEKSLSWTKLLANENSLRITKIQKKLRKILTLPVEFISVTKKLPDHFTVKVLMKFLAANSHISQILPVFETATTNCTSRRSVHN